MKHAVKETHVHPKFPRLYVDLRTKSRFYQARTFLDGQLLQHSTKTTELTTAFKLAAEWYNTLLRGQREHRRLAGDSSLAELFLGYKATLDTPARREYALQKWNPIRAFWGHRLATEVTPITFREFYAWRRKADNVSNSTLHKDAVLIRQILKHAGENNIITALPLIPRPGKIAASGRKWLNHAEWKHLLAVSNQRIKEAKGNPKLLRQRQDCHDFAIFMVHSMLRVDELRHMRFCDCRLDRNADGEDILIVQVQGKTGFRVDRVCLPGAASVYKRRLRKELATEPIFPHKTQHAFRALLEAAELRRDADGRTRNLRSLRSTAISFRVLDGSADVFSIARNAGTSVQMIDDFYAKPLNALMKKDELTRIRKTRDRLPSKRAPKPKTKNRQATSQTGRIRA